jgi:hypothetical protein
MRVGLTKDNLLNAVNPEPNTGCWLWMRYAKRVTSAYFQPRAFYSGKADAVTRIVWKLFYGAIPNGKHVCHKCDTCLCVNPDHLYLGTHQDNMRDLVHRGRGRTHNQKITGYDILKAKQMRLNGMKVVDIANHFNITAKAMGRSLNGGRWGGLKIGG